MKNTKKLLLAAAIALGLGSAQAATSSTTFNVTATVLASCEATAAGDLAFGSFTPTSTAGQNQTASTNLSVLCTPGTAYTVGLGAGTGGGTVPTNRLLVDGSSHTLSYNLYSDSAYTTVFGSTTAGTQVSGTGTGAAQTVTVYGKLPKNQFVTPGNYSSTIDVTVTY